nr:hypothetical protein [Micromonospora sp. DSM 115978]
MSIGPSGHTHGSGDDADDRSSGSSGESGLEPSGLGTDDAIRALLVLMPRMVGRAKRTPIPTELRS